MNKELKILSPAEEVSMADEWFALASKDHFWMKWRFEIIRRQLDRTTHLNNTQKFFEIGCGHGQFIKQFEEAFSIPVDGCDLNVYALKKAPPVRGDIYVYNIFDRSEAVVNRYDGIFLLDVIEHIDDHEKFLTVACEHAKPGGFVVINVPALQSLFSKYDIAAGHKRRYNKKQMKELFSKCGIEMVGIQYWGLSLVAVVYLRKLILKFTDESKVIETGFSSRNGIINSLFKMLFRIETAIFKNPFLGSSLLAVGKIGRPIP